MERAKFQILIVMVILIAGILSMGIMNAVAYEKSYKEIKHGRIVINNNIQFKIMAEKEHWPGNGTKDDPYIIEGYDIDAEGSGYGIFIGNTTVYFVIRNNYIHNLSMPTTSLWSLITSSSIGIALMNVKNGMLENNTIIGGMFGIYLIMSSYNKISNNTCKNNLNGIEIGFLSSNNIVMGNTCESRWYALIISGADHNSVINNTLLGNVSGIFLSMTKNNVFYNNNMRIGGFFFDVPSLIDDTTVESQVIGENNTVNGKTVYYYKNIDANHSVLNSDAGQIIIVKSKNLRIENLSINSTVSINIYFSSNIEINNCSISSPGSFYLPSLMLSYGITVAYSSNISVENSKIEKSTIGIYMGPLSNDNRVLNSTIRDSAIPIYIELAYNNTLENNIIQNGSIVVWGDKRTFVTQSIRKSNRVNEKPVYYYKNLKNISVPKDAGEIIAGNVTEITIKDAHFSNLTGAIFIGYSSKVRIENVHCKNTITPISMLYTNDSIVANSSFLNYMAYGVYLVNSNKNHIENNTFWGRIGAQLQPTAGIYVQDSTFNRIVKNEFRNLTAGVRIYGDNNLVNHNRFVEDYYAIQIEYSINNEIHNNTMLGCDIVITGMDAFSTQNITKDNLVNGKPVYYYKNGNLEEIKVPRDAGQVIVGSVKNLSIENMKIVNTSIGILIGYSTGITIKNITVNKNRVGILIEGGDHITVENSIILGNGEGIQLQFSDYCVISNNIISQNIHYGVNISFGMYNRIYSNDFSYNHGSGDEYDPNHIQARDDGYFNLWNTTERGNYWQDWRTPDNNGDGIVDEPYKIEGLAHARDCRPISESSIPELSAGLFIAILVLLTMLIAKRRRYHSI